jgi:hypothetical protein
MEITVVIETEQGVHKFYKNLGARWLTISNFHIEEPQILRGTVGRYLYTPEVEYI